MSETTVVITPADLALLPNAAVQEALRSRSIVFQGWPDGVDPRLEWEEFLRKPYDLAPSHDPLLQFFSWEHLPPHLGDVSRQFAELARWIDMRLPVNPQRDVALQALLTAKDAAVRARLWKDA